MTAWKLAMLCIAPLMWGGAKPRAWAAVMASSVLAFMVGALDPRAYLLIDIVCGALVLARPAGCFQRAIGGTSLVINKRDVSTYSNLATAALTTATRGISRRLRLRVVGNVITVTIDGEQTLTHTLAGGDATKFGSATSHGFFSDNGGADSKWENWRLRAA